MQTSKEFLHIKIAEWFSLNQRELPWRQTRNPYFIMISEFMLQQTQVSRVIPKFIDFIEKFPTLEFLSQSNVSEIIKSWSGLGYNKRAINLFRSAKMIIDEFKGEFPNDIKNLLLLPGVGEYTASAIICFAFEKAVPVIDINVNRVLERLILGSDKRLPVKTQKEIALQYLNHEDPWTWNQGIMEFGALVCKNIPDCFNCVFNTVCTSPLNRTKIYYEDEKITKPKLQIENKNTPFIQSDRYFRGQLIKFLTLAIEDEWISFEDAYDYIKRLDNSFDEEKLEILLDKLNFDGLIQFSDIKSEKTIKTLSFRLPK